VEELAKRPSIDQINVIADQISSSSGYLHENPRVKVVRVWKQDNPLSILRVVIQVLKLKPDVVHFSIGFQSFGKSRISNFIGLSSIFLCRLYGFKVIVLLHNLASLVNLKKVEQKPSFTNKAGIILATRLILSAKRVVVMVKSYKDYLEKHYKNTRILFIPHGNVTHNCASIDPEDKVILMFGHMGPFKGLSTILRAFENIVKERNDVQLVIAGGNHPNFPTYLEEFIKKAPSKVVFTGYVPEKDLCKVFGKADVVVTPYLLATGTSGVFHLACGFGKPLISSNLPEIRELLLDGASALLIPPGDADALQNAILKILTNKGTATKMAEQNLKFAQKERMSIIAQTYEKTYMDILNN
jgi:glycosyltransferase involved in cell wall biosynthesis